MRPGLGFLLIAGALARALASQEIDPRCFRNPPVEFYPAISWLWNDRMTPEKIREQLEEMRQHKVLTVSIVPEPREFRPDAPYCMALCCLFLVT